MFLGYVSSKAVQSKLSTFDSYLGGSLKTFPSTYPPEAAYIICSNCHEQMYFLMQIYCPLGSSPNHRALYFFVCVHSSCQFAGTNWRVLKCQIPSECLPNENVGTSDWCIDMKNSDDEESWGEVDGTSNQVEEPEIPEHAPEDSQIHFDSHIIGPFEPHYIDVYEDEQSSQSDSNDLNEASCPSSAFELWCKEEAIEQEFVEEDDNTTAEMFSGGLQNYLATRGEYGCEAIRYNWSGKPIFNGKIPKQLKQHLTCHRCGSPRVFEVQLFSTLNNSLFLSTALSCDHPEADKLNKDWLLKITTVLVFSCSVSCSATQNNWTEECVVVQTDSNMTKIIAPKM